MACRGGGEQSHVPVMGAPHQEQYRLGSVQAADACRSQGSWRGSRVARPSQRGLCFAQGHSRGDYGRAGLYIRPNAVGPVPVGPHHWPGCDVGATGRPHTQGCPSVYHSGIHIRPQRRPLHTHLALCARG